MTHSNVTCHTFEFVTSRVRMSHVTHTNDSCHTYMSESCHTYMSQSCHTYYVNPHFSELQRASIFNTHTHKHTQTHAHTHTHTHTHTTHTHTHTHTHIHKHTHTHIQYDHSKREKRRYSFFSRVLGASTFLPPTCPLPIFARLWSYCSEISGS